MGKGRRPNARYLPGQGMPGGMPINQGPAYASLNNNLERYYYNHYFYMLWLIACNRYVWKNLPDGIPSKIIEQILIDNGFGCFGPYMGKKIFARCALSGPLNIYYEPIERELYSVDELHVRVSEKESVIVYNNSARTPTAPYLSAYATRLAKLEAFIAVNLNSNKTPIIMQMPNQKATLSIKNLYAKFEGNEPATILMDNFDQLPIQAINTGAEWKIDKAQEYKRQIWNEAMIFLGIRTSPVEKKERVNVMESLSNIQQVQIMRQTELNTRLEACAAVNTLWGTNIIVDLSVPDEMDIIEAQGGGIIGSNNESNGSSNDSKPNESEPVPNNKR